MSSLSASLRLFSPKLPQTFPKSPFFPSKPFLIFSSSISFQRLPKSPLSEPLRAQQREAEVDLCVLPPRLQEIIVLFQSVPEPKAKYQQLLHYGAQLPPLDPRFKTDDQRVRGCVSQVWVRAFRDADDPAAVRFEADSDSALTKGLAALLVFGLSGSLAPVIASVPPGFVHLLGLQQSLTPSRNNGFLNMLKLMQQKALQLYSQVGNSEINGVSESKGGNSGAKGGILEDKISILGEKTDKTGEDSIFREVLSANRSGDSLPYGHLKVDGHGMDSADVVQKSSGGGIGGRRERIRQGLERELSPVELEVEDISYQHAGHAGVRGNSDGETHFNVRVVSKEFEGKSLVKRHRLVYDLLQEELQTGLHALSIVAKTPSEAQSS
ncbi:sufE-like protein 1, chloroplastic/mitochondrial isoform X1 [Phoenix dactylifera]|uniref:SufE-like protein 1, chloroplastic/mitochondrial isoform X1 n=1 Tax=Phoenix dactylifera TaxID=42345 RepID=A0A8B9AIQ2_PHODC|nr:sufE-like protein 1, chloroplastic/mitochondrial isoform X1 [Phoenix dactylifera]XP_038983879.1 sufE-like protein 1, chloroplastic/mitochondrial isoform X1 [Phoenix dactylifera]